MVGVALACAARVLGAQDVGAGEPRLVSSQVVMPTAREGAAPTPVPGQWVILHRVGTDRAGPLDSMRTAADGRYTFHYRTSGQADAVYFASVTYAGIAYFSNPLRRAEVKGEEGEIFVFDTTSSRATLSVQGRHVVVAAPRPDGTREIGEVLELANDSVRTLVARDTLTPIWSLALPTGATEFKVGDGDVASQALVERNGRVELYAPISPGVRQLTWSYRLPASAFPLSLPAQQFIVQFEVLIEEPLSLALGPRVHKLAPVTAGERVYQRFLVDSAPAGEVLRVQVPQVHASVKASSIRGIAIAVGSVMLLALALFAARRTRPMAGARPSSAAAAAPGEGDAQRLLRELAMIDSRLESGSMEPSARAELEAERSAVKARAKAALAAEDPTA
ncbi:MAG: hypothetical protein JWO05_2364 [Gemmatimonadetes bacterium]|nr:hypothetical protein [Gemmatimonadota bacterium]